MRIVLMAERMVLTNAIHIRFQLNFLKSTTKFIETFRRNGLDQMSDERDWMARGVELDELPNRRNRINNKIYTNELLINKNALDNFICALPPTLTEQND